MWWLVWIVLVLGALGTGALLLLRLWRQAKALGREAAAAGELGARLDPGEPDPMTPHVPGASGDRATLDAAVAARARIADERARRRRARLARAGARWHAHGLTDLPVVAGRTPATAERTPVTAAE
ncbi:hypothetical protein [Georgenia thermotolerans]|uniref:Uncharacterized protein n=1 Tax=Georgenia thermotolerans TaxID=527326 RepID=A0A7J5UKA6_9MICO|nr:hypothetical protein [Georgenia thermotolerans]KAE8762701.1 hypothetical protein GB883_17975 [Georgenia thermotolerans]